MKFDMHCHTKEGSPDAKVSIVEYANKLKECGFSGMLVTDHDSYKGYKAWERDLYKYGPEDFTVLRGIEYDTIDAGHFLVIMPSDVNLKVLELRGLPVYILIDIVHKHGGILGPAHPFGERYLSIFHTGVFKHHTQIARQFDFLEGFNACEDKERNIAACRVANEYGLAKFGGSDSHKLDNVGLAYTLFPDDVSIENEDDLIYYIKRGGTTKCGGRRYYGTTKVKIGGFNQILVQSFWFYNKALGLLKHRKRFNELDQLGRYYDITDINKNERV